MTGPSGNRLSICPLSFRIASPRVPIDLGPTISAYYLETSHHLFNILLLCHLSSTDDLPNSVIFMSRPYEHCNKVT